MGYHYLARNVSRFFARPAANPGSQFGRTVIITIEENEYRVGAALYAGKAQCLSQAFPLSELAPGPPDWLRDFDVPDTGFSEKSAEQNAHSR